MSDEDEIIVHTSDDETGKCAQASGGDKDDSVKASGSKTGQFVRASGDVAELCQMFSEEISACVSDDEIHVPIDYGNTSADEDDLNTTNSSLAYLTHVREARKRTVDGSPRRTCTTRVVACTGLGFLVVCLIMVGVSLLLSKNIDDMGK